MSNKESTWSLYLRQKVWEDMKAFYRAYKIPIPPSPLELEKKNNEGR